MLRRASSLSETAGRGLCLNSPRTGNRGHALESHASTHVSGFPSIDGGKREFNNEMSQLVVYGGSAAMQHLPKALRAAVAAAKSAGAAVAIIKRSAWYLGQANSARQAIVKAFTNSISGWGGGGGGVQRNVVPKVQTNRAMYQRGAVTGSIVQSHREYVMDVSPTSAAFEKQKLIISPSDRILFKSLAYISRCFDKYRFRKLRFVYVPSCATTTGGRVAGAFEYDLNDPEPTGKVDLYAMEGSKRGPFFENLSWDMTPTGWLDVSLTGAEPKLSCPGYFIFAMMECDSVGVKGELYVEYEVELKIATKFVPVAQALAVAQTLGVAANFTTSGDGVAKIVAQTIVFNVAGTFLLIMSTVNSALGTIAFTPGPDVVSGGTRNAQSATASLVTLTVTVQRNSFVTMVLHTAIVGNVTLSITEA